MWVGGWVPLVHHGRGVEGIQIRGPLPTYVKT